MKRVTKTAVSLFLCAVLLLAATPLALASESGLELAVMSDIHYFPKEYIGSPDGYNYRCTVDNDRKLIEYADEIIDAALEDIAQKAPAFLILPGDLAMSGQYEAHVQVAAKLKRLEQAGTQVYVIPGNHDISQEETAISFSVPDNSITREVAGETYTVDEIVPVKGTTVSDFRSVYADFGYGEDDKIISRRESDLSYAVQLNSGYRLIAIDANIYNGEYYANEKALSGDLMKWVTAQVEACLDAGDIPLAMMHYNIIEKYPGQSVVMGNNYLPDRKKVTNSLANCGLEYLFTGHSHANEITGLTTSKGNTIFEVCTGSLLLHGSPYRFVSFNGADAQIRAAKVRSIPGIEDFQAFCSEYFYPGGVRIMMRNRAVVVASQALAEAFESERLPYDEGYAFFVETMGLMIDGILAMELDRGVTVEELLSEAYKQHYGGDEVYTDDMKAAVAKLKSGDAFEQALVTAFESIGETTGISGKLAGISENYRRYLRNAVAECVLSGVSNILGAMGGEFMEGIFIDIAPSDNDVDITGGVACSPDGTQAPAATSRQILRRDFLIVLRMIFRALGFKVTAN